VSVLCADTSVTLGDLESPPGHPIAPTAVVRINTGRLLANTASSSSAFQPLTLRVDTQAGPLLTAGATRLTVEPLAALVASGSVTLNGARLPASGPAPACGDGTALPVGADASREPPTVVTDAPSLPSLSPSDSSSSASTEPEEEPVPGPTRPGTTNPPTTNPPTQPPTTQPTTDPTPSSSSSTQTSDPPTPTPTPTVTDPGRPE
jgi:putative peptide zinc metalloprotease protein